MEKVEQGMIQGAEGNEIEAYIRVRELEGRLLPDDIAVELPIVSKSSPYYQEWLWRKRSFARLQAYLSKRFQGPGVKVLDLGCGNGWMSHGLASEPRFEVLGIERNLPELAQAKRLFSRENLRFSGADVLAGGLGGQQFDVMVLAAVVQYFPDLEKLIQILRAHLLPKGEIHLLDTRFYPNEKARLAAKARSKQYYSQLKVPEMAVYYHHHTAKEIALLGGKNMNNHLTIRFLQKVKWLSPLDWFVVA